MKPLPDFLRLSDEDAAREKQRQDKLRQDFNSRVKLTSVEVEAGRAQMLVPSLIEGIASAEGEEKDRLKNQLAEAYAAQGFFLKASRIAVDKDERKFYRDASAALTQKECSCSGPIETVENRQVKMPKYRVIKEINSLVHGQFGFLVECQKCGNWCFVGSDATANVS